MPERPPLIAFVRRLTRWLVAHPLFVCLPMQAALLFTDLRRLPMWGDEHGALWLAAQSFDELVTPAPRSVHPPLYFLLLHEWLSLPWDADVITRARCLSALCVLLATVAIDRCWLRHLERTQRVWFLVLWTLSPALLLYGRMARSYSLQLLLASVALYAGCRSVAAAPVPSPYQGGDQACSERHRRGEVPPRASSLVAVLAYSGVLAALFYTHYLPAVAVMAAATVVGLARLLRDPRPTRFVALLLPPVLIGVALMPLLPQFRNSVGQVGGASPYSAMGSRWLESLVSLGYTFVSFTFGESLRPWTVGAALVLTPAIVGLLVRGVLRPPEWLVLVAVAAVVAFAGAWQWTSYAFAPARVFFLLPFYLLLLVHAARALPRMRALVFGALACVSVGGIEAYSAQEGFLNKAYAIPFAQIARHVRDRSGGSAIVLILDHRSTSLTSMTADLPAATHTIVLRDLESLRQAVELAEGAPAAGVVWFARNAHDTSPDGWNAQVEAAFTRGFRMHRERFCEYSALDHWLMRRAGWREQPSHVIELLEMRRIEPRPTED